MEGFFRFTGWVKGDQKQKLLETSDLFFLPSYTEAMPMSILEAMGYALPIVASNVGGIPQLVKNGVNGFMANPGDKEQFADEILSLLQDTGLCYQMSEASINIAGKYSLEKHIEKISILYRKILSEGT